MLLLIIFVQAERCNLCLKLYNSHPSQILCGCIIKLVEISRNDNWSKILVFGFHVVEQLLIMLVCTVHVHTLYIYSCTILKFRFFLSIENVHAVDVLPPILVLEFCVMASHLY